MNIEILLTEAEIAGEFAESLEARDLPEKFFYWTLPSVKAWQAVASGSEAVLRGTWDDLAAKAADITKAFGKRVPVISFGAGDGQMDRILLKALAAAGREVKYFPVDASQILLEAACAGAEDDECEAMGVKADISSPMHLILASDVTEAPRLFLMVGNTLGGFDPLDQIRHVAECIHKGDILIIDALLHTDPVVQPSEDQKRFVFAPLAAAGIKVDDGDLEFVEKKDDRLEGLFMVTRRLLASRDLQLLAAGREFQVARGERILLNFRYRYTKEAFRKVITKYGALKIVGEILSPDGSFMTAVCIKA